MRIIYIETKEVRPPKNGEWFISSLNGFMEMRDTFFTRQSYAIFARLEVPDDVAERILKMKGN